MTNHYNPHPQPGGGRRKEDEMLCKKCYQAQGRIELEDKHPWDHCHHEEEIIKITGHEKGKPNPILEQGVTTPLCPSAWEPMKPKCWCDYDKEIRNNYNVSIRAEDGCPNPVWTIKFCPVCGKKMEAK